jgi:hypothetical protein
MLTGIRPLVFEVPHRATTTQCQQQHACQRCAVGGQRTAAGSDLVVRGAATTAWGVFAFALFAFAFTLAGFSFAFAFAGFSFAFTLAGLSFALALAFAFTLAGFSFAFTFTFALALTFAFALAAAIVAVVEMGRDDVGAQ